MELAENITLIIAVFWVLWQIFSIRDAAIHAKGIFPALIPSSILFGISIALILFFHLSPFHLIWLSLACFLFGFLALISPQIQGLSMGLFVLLAMTGNNKTDDNNEAISGTSASLGQKSKPKKAKKEKRGFG